MDITPHKVIFSQSGMSQTKITVCTTLYNYEAYICEALNSIAAQTLETFDLIVVEDRSQDNSLKIALDWIQSHAQRFNSIYVLQQDYNNGTAHARNTGFQAAQTEVIFVLDADNQVYPRCLQRCLEALQVCDAAFAYPVIEDFGDRIALRGVDVWSVDRLSRGNYIDAMTMIRKACWSQVGGYSSLRGWEDYDLWCKFASAGFWGVQVPEILARYRVHSDSKTYTQNVPLMSKMVAGIKQRHPWLRI